MKMSIQLKLQPLTDINSKTQIEEPNTNQMRIKCQTTPIKETATNSEKYMKKKKPASKKPNRTIQPIEK